MKERKCRVHEWMNFGIYRKGDASIIIEERKKYNEHKERKKEKQRAIRKINGKTLEICNMGQ